MLKWHVVIAGLNLSVLYTIDFESTSNLILNL